MAIGEPAPLPSGLISLSRHNKMEKNNACAGSLLLLWIDPLPGRRKNRKWMEREFFDVLWCSCHVLWCFFFKIRCSVFCQTASIGLSSQHMTSELDRIELESRSKEPSLHFSKAVSADTHQPALEIPTCLTCLIQQHQTESKHPSHLGTDDRRTFQALRQLSARWGPLDCWVDF